MNNKNNPRLTSNAQSLRKDMTKQERHLWYDFLKGLPVTFNRQKVIGKYIVDFYCAKAGVVIEVDGEQHYDRDGMERDKIRDAFLHNMGLKVLRYTNLEIDRNFNGVCEDILRHISTSSASLRSAPSPQGEGL